MGSTEDSTRPIVGLPTNWLEHAEALCADLGLNRDLEPLNCTSSWGPCLGAESQRKCFRQHHYHSS